MQGSNVSNWTDNVLNFPTRFTASSTASRREHVLMFIYCTHVHKQIMFCVADKNVTDSLKLELKDKFDLNPHRQKF